VVVLYPGKGGMAVVDEAEVSRRFGIPGRSYADYAILRGDPSDGLPGVKGVGERTAADLVRRYGGVAGLLAEGRLSEDDRDYVGRALRVVPPGTREPVPLPRGTRDGWPVDPARLAELAPLHGVESACERLLKALGGR